MNGNILESTGAAVPGRRPYTDPFTGVVTPYSISATARSPKAYATAIRADLGEAEAYKEALHKRGEIGLQRPMGANVRGVDFITAVKNPHGNIEIVITDVKTTTTGRRAPTPKTYIPRTWQMEVQEAIARLKLNDPNLEIKIREAYKLGRVRLRQLHVNYAPDPAHGMGKTTGW
jgi:hypothetical protein